MQEYQKLYTHLFNAVTDALDAIEKRNYGTAETLLKEAQKWTENVYVEWEETEEK